ncbi:uncharacterized protein LOC127814221 isoform X2 [Diospyros lotus]|uniref:uncharacterized protein LOC127814221 isoform X2 n=1 Tax=Diospyros lotus TaxID=55363 RepID=UPI00224F26E8|nr:uncharacterized protein LOC127814221 isoform X2 [Diospyros lotus]
MREVLRSGDGAEKAGDGEVTEKDDVDTGLNMKDGMEKKRVDFVESDLDCVKDSSVSLKDGKIDSGSEDVETGEDAAVNADTAGPKITTGQGERKRKRTQSSDVEEVKVNLVQVNGHENKSTDDNEKQGQVLVLTDPASVEDSSSSPGRATEGKASGSWVECNEKGDENAHGDNHIGTAKIKTWRRGRKRKIVESSVCSQEGGTQEKKVKSDVTIEFVGRILRSRTVAMRGADSDMADSGVAEGLINVKEEKEIDASSKKVIEMENDINAKSMGSKKEKGRRGRPRKVQQESPMGNSEKVKGRRGRPRKVQLEISIERSQKLKGRRGRPPKVQQESPLEGTAQSVVKKQNTLKGRRGRPPKVQQQSAPLKMTVIGKQQKVRSRKDHDQTKSDDVTRGSKFVDGGKHIKVAIPSHQGGQEVSVKLTEQDNPKEGGESRMRRSTVKQLLRERIIAMLKSAGWTIKYRPRLRTQGSDAVGKGDGHAVRKEYNDAIYVSPQGKGYWSVTLAYKILKQEVENGNADSSAISAFTPIPEEEFSKLFRITKKKLELKMVNKGKRGRASKTSEGVRGKILPRGLKRSNGGERQNRRRCALLARDSMKDLDPSSEGFVLYDGKRNLISWMIDLGTVPLNGKVQYMNRRRSRALLQGRITRDGIHCDCCNGTFAVADFESHAGSKLAQPFQNIYLESGSSLFKCLFDSWSKHERLECIGFHSVDVDGADRNDDTCNMCGDGGDLICCDGCPSTFHQDCLNIQFPSGEWYCVYCTCKFCGMLGDACQSDQNIRGSALVVCSLCEEKYHRLCAQGKDAAFLDSSSSSFCGRKCQEVFDRLQKLLGVKNELEEGFSWTLIQRSDISQDTSCSNDSQKVEWNSKLAVAFSVMDECFLPILDHRSGANMIHNVVYSCGSNFSRLNYSRFFTAILERDDELISVASIRIHGNCLAEMPFIGTRHMYRRQGMCRRLLNGIESALCCLNVEKLVIPAISELMHTWTSVFGFMPLEELKKKEMKYMNIIVFPGVDMLQKPLLMPQFSRENLFSTAAIKTTEPQTEPQILHERAGDSDICCSTGVSSKVSQEVAVHAYGTTGMASDNQVQDNKDIKDSKASGRNALEHDRPYVIEVSNKQQNVGFHCINVPQKENSKFYQHSSLEVDTNSSSVYQIQSDAADGVRRLLDANGPEACGGNSLEHNKQYAMVVANKQHNVDFHPMNVPPNVDSRLLHSTPKVDTNSSIISQVQSDATDGEKQSFLASDNKGEEDAECLLNGVVNAVDHVPVLPAEIIVQPENAECGAELYCESDDILCGLSPQSLSGAPDVGNFCDASIPKDGNPGSFCLRVAPGSHEPEVVAEVQNRSVTLCGDLSNPVGVSQASCVVTGNDNRQKEVTAAQTDSHYPDADSVLNKHQMSTGQCQKSEPGSLVDHSSVSVGESGLFCSNPNSSPGLTCISTSGACNASGSTEVESRC